MGRPRKGEKGCEEANAKWRATMLERCGGAEKMHKKMSVIGRKGGMASSTGGFASEKRGADGLTGPERAKICGSKGGKISKRGPATYYK